MTGFKRDRPSRQSRTSERSTRLAVLNLGERGEQILCAVDLEFRKRQRTTVSFLILSWQKCRHRDAARSCAIDFKHAFWRNAVSKHFLYLFGPLERSDFVKDVAEFRLRKTCLLPINANAFAHFNINWVWRLAAKRFLTFWHS